MKKENKNPIKKCKKCGKLYLKFDHIPKDQPCPHCINGEKNRRMD